LGLTNVIKYVRVCLKINQSLKSTSFFDFNYFSSSSIKLGGDLSHVLNENYSKSLPPDLSNRRLDIPIDLIPMNFTRFRHFKSNFDLNAKIFNWQQNSKFYPGYTENMDQILNPMGLDRRFIFSVRSKSTNTFDFMTELIPKTPCKTLRLYSTQLPSFALGFLLRLFKHRPIWTKKCSETFIPISIKKYLTQIFPILSYRFKGKNPFKDTWIRYGFDPRKNSNTFIYQTIGFTCKINKLKDSSNKHHDPLRSPKITNCIKKTIQSIKCNSFGIPKKQMCDLDEYEYKKIRIKNRLKYINPQTGWLFQ